MSRKSLINDLKEELLHLMKILVFEVTTIIARFLPSMVIFFFIFG